MKNKELAKLLDLRKGVKEAAHEHFKKWLKDGNKLTQYECPYCKRLLFTPQPKKDMCSSKGFWDSAMICYECGKVSFVRVYPSGKTEVFKIRG